jgi:methyl acetate hydrolase
MNSGELDGNRIVKPETVTLVGQNHMGALDVQPMSTQNPHMSNRVDLFPGMSKKWGLTFLIYRDQPCRPQPRQPRLGRREQHLLLAGPYQKITSVLMTQILPFADPTVLEALNAFESAVYQTVG